MNNWKLRLGAALTTLGIAIAAISPTDILWLRTGLCIAAAGGFFKVLFPESDGGQKAADQLPETNKP